MSALRKSNLLSVEEYLHYEQDSPIRHEYVHGELFAMAGGSRWHNRIARNLCNRLDQHLVNDRCEPSAFDMKVCASETLYYYPDVVVACDDPETTDPHLYREPILLVEVSSPGTAVKDRTEKLEAYQRIPTLKEYVIIAQDQVSVHLYRRNPKNGWTHQVLTNLSDELELKSVGLRVSLSEIYLRVIFPAPHKLKRQRHPNAEGE